MPLRRIAMRIRSFSIIRISVVRILRPWIVGKSQILAPIYLRNRHPGCVLTFFRRQRQNRWGRLLAAGPRWLPEPASGLGRLLAAGPGRLPEPAVGPGRPVRWIPSSKTGRTSSMASGLERFLPCRKEFFLFGRIQSLLGRNFPLVNGREFFWPGKNSFLFGRILPGQEFFLARGPNPDP